MCFVADTYLYVPPRRYVFCGAEAYGRLVEEEDSEDDDDDDDNDDDDDDSSLVMPDNGDNTAADRVCSDSVNPAASSDSGDPLCPPTPVELSNSDSSSGSVDP